MAISPDLLSLLSDRELAAFVTASLAERTGDERYSRAAGCLRGKRGGRRAIDDSNALQQMADLLEAGGVDSPEAAANAVARTLSVSCNCGATAKRIARKFRSTRN